MTSHGQILVVTLGSRRACAIPLSHVVEILRPLPIEPIVGAARFLRGVSLIRGTPTPVVDLASLLGGEATLSCGRFVTLKLGPRRVALGVESVVGVRELDTTTMAELPPLLRDGAGDLLEAIDARDSELLFVLRATRLIPDDLWQALAAAPEPLE